MAHVLFAGGSRSWTCGTEACAVLDTVVVTKLLHGACGLDADEPFDAKRLQGADRVFHEAATARGILVEPHAASWRRFRLKAGPIRNEEMARLGPKLAVQCVVGRVGQRVGKQGAYLTNGSQHMADCLRSRAIPLAVFRWDGIEPIPLAQGDRMALALGESLGYLLGVYLAFRDSRLVPAGKALRKIDHRARARYATRELVQEIDSILVLLAEARNILPGAAPWIQTIEATLKPISSG